jgi:hypothetical protein
MHAAIAVTTLQGGAIVTETLRIDTSLVNEAAGRLEALAGEIPPPPAAFSPEGADGLSVAIAGKVTEVVAPVLAQLPVSKEELTRYAQNVMNAANTYDATDRQLAEEILKRLEQMDSTEGAGSPGGGGASTAAAATSAAGSAASPMSGAAGAASQGGQLGQMMGMPMQMAQQAAGMAASAPQGLMQGVQGAVQQVSDMAGKGDDAAPDSDETAPAADSQAAPGDSAVERAPEPQPAVPTNTTASSTEAEL